MFIMLSGALLLQEDKPFDTKIFYRKKLLPMFLLTIGWLITYGVFYSVILPALLNKNINFSNFISYIFEFKGSEYPHLWYMLMVLKMHWIYIFKKMCKINRYFVELWYNSIVVKKEK